jgi:phosphotransferase system enzyme I (PtsI)
MRTYRGIAASPGIAVGQVRLVRKARPPVVERVLTDAEVAPETSRLRAAVAAGQAQLETLARRHAGDGKTELASILEAQFLLLQDPAILAEAEDRIRSRKRNAAAVVAAVVEENAATLAALPDSHLAARAADVRDVGERILRNLRGLPDAVAVGAGACLVFADDLAPSDMAGLRPGQILALVTEAGGPTSHTAIIAKGLEIPAVVGVGELGTEVRDGVTAVVDGERGLAVLEPDEMTLNEYRERLAASVAGRERLASLRGVPALTTDGRRIALAANLGHPREAARAVAYGADGVGLYRTEFLFLDRPDLPGEDEQYEVYRSAAEAFGERPVIVRTLDVGGDKGILPLGLCVDRREIFVTQLRALWRASLHGNVQVMFPMITTVEELRRAKAVLAEAGRELDDKGSRRGRKLPTGIMVETPAAVASAHLLAREVEFLSLGTNDLTQYVLAVDRGDALVSHLYDPFHPAVLNLIAATVGAAHQAGIWCGLCGEMAADAAAAPFLVGIGLDELSMSPAAIPLVKEAVRGLSAARAVGAARKALSAESAAQARQVLTDA